jgi:hypothetical protein
MMVVLAANGGVSLLQIELVTFKDLLHFYGLCRLKMTFAKHLLGISYLGK